MIISLNSRANVVGEQSSKKSRFGREDAKRFHHHRKQNNQLVSKSWIRLVLGDDLSATYLCIFPEITGKRQDKKNTKMFFHMNSVSRAKRIMSVNSYIFILFPP